MSGDFTSEDRKNLNEVHDASISFSEFIRNQERAHMSLDKINEEHREHIDNIESFVDQTKGTFRLLSFAGIIIVILSGIGYMIMRGL